MTTHIKGDKVLHEGKEKVVRDVSPMHGDTLEDRKLDRLVLRPADDPNGEMTFGHPDDCQIIGHIDGYVNPVTGVRWDEVPPRSGNWKKTMP